MYLFYSVQVLIKSKAENIVPPWMRFVKGVVDSEDVPLNLSRELLQDSAQIRRLRTVVTNKFLRFMQDRARKEPKSFQDFYKDYAFFFKEGIITSTDQYEKEEIGKLLRFESSKTKEGEQGRTDGRGFQARNCTSGVKEDFFLCMTKYFESFCKKISSST